MWGTRVQKISVLEPSDPVNLTQFQPDLTVGENGSTVFPVNSFKGGFQSDNPQPVGKSGNASSAVTAHGPFLSVRIVIAHSEILAPGLFQDDQTVTPDPEPAIADLTDQGTVQKGSIQFPSVDHNKVIASAVVF
jgi:hypothetical protein